jgi:hypothetical protein
MRAFPPRLRFSEMEGMPRPSSILATYLGKFVKRIPPMIAMSRRLW